MSRKTTKLIIVVVVLVALIGGGIGLYFALNQGPIVGHIEYDVEYHLVDIRPTERFDGAKMNRASYFKINYGGKTGELKLVGLNANSALIPLIITNYKEGIKQTVIDFEYIINQGEKTEIQHLQAISTNSEIRIQAVEKHGVGIIQQNPDEIDYLEYKVTIMVFRRQEVTKWFAAVPKLPLSLPSS